MSSDSHSTACSLFYCLWLRCERGSSNFENGGDFVWIIADVAYRLTQYGLKGWMLIQKLAFGAFIHGCPTLCRGNDRRFCNFGKFIPQRQGFLPHESSSGLMFRKTFCLEKVLLPSFSQRLCNPAQNIIQSLSLHGLGVLVYLHVIPKRLTSTFS